MDANTKIIGLIGYPCRHSLSPLIQNSFIKQCRKNAVYMIFEFKLDRLHTAYAGMKSLGFLGFNVTMPYKEKIFEMVDQADGACAATRSVNTVHIGPDRTARGFNTDVEGFIQAARQKGCRLTENALVIGAGGAARSSIYGLLQEKAAKIYVYNRTLEKAIDIKTLFEKNDSIEVIDDLNKLNEQDIMFVINCTPMGMDIGNGLKDALPVPRKWDLGGKYVMDMVYKPVQTPLIRKAVQEGAKVINGIDMLVSQAAYSFKIWFQATNLPETKQVKVQLKKIIENGAKHGS